MSIELPWDPIGMASRSSKHWSDWIGGMGKSKKRVTRPGKHDQKNDGKSQFLMAKQPLFLCPFSIACCMFTRG